MPILICEQFPVQANPDLMKQAVDIMGQMDPEQMASMMGSMGPGMPGGQADPSAMAGLLADPKSRELMRQMMSNIDPQQLAAMSKASGQALTPEQVRLMLLIAHLVCHASLACSC